MDLTPAAYARHGIGGNMPPAEPIIFPSLDEMIDPVVLTEQWTQTHAPLLKRADELRAAAEGFLAKNQEISDEDTLKRLEDMIKLQIQPVVNESKREFQAAKAPFLNASLAADAFFTHGITNVLLACVETLRPLKTSFLLAKSEREKAEREERARLARLEAERLATEAMEAKNAALVGEALKADDRAARFEKHAAATIADLSRTRTDNGVVSGLKDVWVYEIADFAEVPREWLMIDDAKVRAAIRGKNGVRAIPGLVIRNEQKAR